jgi:hypothetical protein
MTTWAFVDGIKVVNGRRVPLAKSQTYLSSNGSTIYTRCWWSDGTQSCNCPGWAKNPSKATGGDRTCGHVQGKYEDRRVVGPVAGQVTVAPTTMAVEVGPRSRGRVVGREE